VSGFVVRLVVGTRGLLAGVRLVVGKSNLLQQRGIAQWAFGPPMQLPNAESVPGRPEHYRPNAAREAQDVLLNISPILSDPVSILQVKTMLAEAEKYVDAVVASEFLGVTTRFLLDLTRAGRIPGHPLGLGSKRRVWRFRLSELESSLCHGGTSPAFPTDSRAKSTEQSV